MSVGLSSTREVETRLNVAAQRRNFSMAGTIAVQAFNKAESVLGMLDSSRDLAAQTIMVWLFCRTDVPDRLGRKNTAQPGPRPRRRLNHGSP
jgi:hypothetical protein